MRSTEIPKSRSWTRSAFPELLKAIYDAVDGLEAMFPGRHFTPDGHMVGSIGEALAAHHYGVVLAGASNECHDGICGTRQVQVKATQGTKIAISSEPEHLLVLRIERDGTFTEEFNGPGSVVWQLVKDRPRPKKRAIPSLVVDTEEPDGCRAGIGTPRAHDGNRDSDLRSVGLRPYGSSRSFRR